MSKDHMNIEKFRSFFPIFRQMIHGNPLRYFDSAATAQVPQMVIDAMVEYYSSYKANVGRGIYDISEKATKAYENSRAKVARYLGALPDQIVFTSGATHSINLVMQSWATKNVTKGDEILVSSIEHYSNFLPWYQLAQQTGCSIRMIPVNEYGVIDLTIVRSMVSHKTKLIAITHTSNSFGSTSNIKEIVRIAAEYTAAVLVDASQSIAHQKIDVIDLGCDFLVFSGHKLFGPTGVGVLYARSDKASVMRPVQFGGGMVIQEHNATVTYKPYPHGLEAGTPNISGVIGLGAAIDFVNQQIDFIKLQEHETYLVEHTLSGLQKLKGIKIISFKPHKNEHAHIVTFISDVYHAHDIAAYLNQFGIAVRAGNHCARDNKLMSCNVGCTCVPTASVRISFSGYNTIDEVDYLVSKLTDLCGY